MVTVVAEIAIGLVSSRRSIIANVEFENDAWSSPARVGRLVTMAIASDPVAVDEGASRCVGQGNPQDRRD